MNMELKNKEKEIVDYRATYGINIGDVYYKYETVGRPYWGMKKFIIVKIGTGCMCCDPFYIEFEFINNYGEKSKTHVSSRDLKDYSITEIEAWDKYIKYLNYEINHHNEIINNLKKSQIEAIENIALLDMNDKHE